MMYTTPARIDKGLPGRGDVYLLRLYGKDCVYSKDLKEVLREYFTLAYTDTENIEDCLLEIGDEDVIQLRRVVWLEELRIVCGYWRFDYEYSKSLLYGCDTAGMAA